MNSPILFAQSEVLTWEDCVKQTIEKHPDLTAAREKIRQARADKGIATSALLPQFSSSLSGSTSRAPGKITSDSYSFGLTGDQLIFDGFKTPVDIKIASVELTIEEYRYTATSSNIRLNLRDAYITFLRAQELISLTNEIAQRRRQNLELVELRYEAGREHRGAVLVAEADLAEAEFEVLKAERSFYLAQRALSEAIGFSEFRRLEIQGTLDMALSRREMPEFESLIECTPLLKQVIAQKESARLNYVSSMLDFFPRISLNGSVSKSAAEWPPVHDRWTAGVALSFPVFSGGRRMAQSSKAKSQLRQAHADELSERNALILSLQDAWISLQNSFDEVNVQEKFLIANRERAQIANVQYSNALISFDDWIIIENNLVNGQKAYLDARANVLIAEAKWVQSKGGTLEDVEE